MIKTFFQIILMTFVLTGCIKFDDPEVEAVLLDSYASPCSTELTDNLMTTNINGFPTDPFNFQNPTYSVSQAKVTGSPSSGSCYIYLGTPITESRTYTLNFPFIDQDEAKIEYTDSGFGALAYNSTSGELYVQYNSDTDIIFEWCDISCQDSNGNLKNCTGRLIIE